MELESEGEYDRSIIIHYFVIQKSKCEESIDWSSSSSGLVEVFMNMNYSSLF